jgi:hypothetical protein
MKKHLLFVDNNASFLEEFISLLDMKLRILNYITGSMSSNEHFSILKRNRRFSNTRSDENPFILSDPQRMGLYKAGQSEKISRHAGVNITMPGREDLRESVFSRTNIGETILKHAFLFKAVLDGAYQAVAELCPNNLAYWSLIR